MYRIGIDLGGTHIAAGLVDEDARLIAKLTMPSASPRPAMEIIKDIAALAMRLLDEQGVNLYEVESMGVGVPGTVNRRTGIIEFSNNLGFHNADFARPLMELVKVPVVLDNDANAAAWGEYMSCRERAESFIMITLGTGVGSGVIIDGRMLRGINFGAGELGHTVIEMGGRQCTCGRRGCFEAYASATALIKSAVSLVNEHPDSRILGLAGGDAGKIDARKVFDAAALGDDTAKELLDSYTTYLAEGLANIINAFQPEIICIGGGVSNAGDALLLPVRQKVSELIFTRNSARNTEIILATQGNDAGIIGAALSSLEEKISN